MAKSLRLYLTFERFAQPIRAPICELFGVPARANERAREAGKLQTVLRLKAEFLRFSESAL